MAARNGRNRVLGEVANVVPVERGGRRRKPLGNISVKPVKPTNKSENVLKDSATDNLKAELKKKAVLCEKENEAFEDQPKVKSTKETVKVAVEDIKTEEEKVSKSSITENINKENVALENLSLQDDNACDVPIEMSIDEEICKILIDDNIDEGIPKIEEEVTKIQIEEEVTKIQIEEEVTKIQIDEVAPKIEESNEVTKIQIDEETVKIFEEEVKVKPVEEVQPSDDKEKAKSEPQSEDKENVELEIEEFELTPTTTQEDDVSEMSIDTFEPHEDDWCFSKMLILSFPEYEEEIQKYLLRMQVKYRADPAYLVKHKNELNSKMRTILVDWMVEVVEEYKMTSETLFLAVNFVDRFLSNLAVLRSNFQLLGTTALFISSKYEEIYPPDISEFVYITDNAYDKLDILGMEVKVLKALEFNISGPTIHYFLRKHLCTLGLELGLPQTVGIMAEYLCYLALMECEFLAYLPNDIAVSAIILAADIFGIDVTLSGEAVQAFFPGYTLEQLKAHLVELQSCIDTLHSLRKATKEANDALFKDGKSQQAIFTKYGQEKYFSVSLLDIGEQESPKLLL